MLKSNWKCGSECQDHQIKYIHTYICTLSTRGNLMEKNTDGVMVSLNNSVYFSRISDLDYFFEDGFLLARQAERQVLT